MHWTLSTVPEEIFCRPLSDRGLACAGVINVMELRGRQSHAHCSTLGWGPVQSRDLALGRSIIFWSKYIKDLLMNWTYFLMETGIEYVTSVTTMLGIWPWWCFVAIALGFFSRSLQDIGSKGRRWKSVKKCMAKGQCGQKPKWAICREFSYLKLCRILPNL